MSYEVLARKWRPRNFAELVGQEHVVRPLVNALDHNRLHHAFLFTGTRGVGKTTIARILAKSLNCETGITSKPCGQCSACTEVDGGRFIDLIEVDAASRTKVDDTRELLDNVQYAPTRGRYKVYLIDEVHMLSGHSFNALLKTLEEPPPHVKFLLATTDPQKLPVTILSRCLQFNLRRLTPQEIGAQLKKILDTEQVEHDEASVTLLARAADGSMRDGLSLLDQAIAYGGGRLVETDVRRMLGTIDHQAVEGVLLGLAEGDVRKLLDTVAAIAEHNATFDSLLSELQLAFHQIALLQADASIAPQIENEYVARFADQFSPEDVQLFYEILLLGKRDLPLAPDPRTGAEMTLLRMHAFRPESGRGHAAAAPAPPRKAPVNVAESAPVVTKPVTPPSATAGWAEICTELKIGGLVRELAMHMVLKKQDGDVFRLMLDQSRAQLLNKEREAELAKALSEYCGRPVKINVEMGSPDIETPAQTRTREKDERMQHAVAAIETDPNVQLLKEQLGARVNPASIRPKA